MNKAEQKRYIIALLVQAHSLYKLVAVYPEATETLSFLQGRLGDLCPAQNVLHLNGQYVAWLRNPAAQAVPAPITLDEGSPIVRALLALMW